MREIYQMRRIIIIPLFFLSIAASATNYYVKNGGSDSNTGLDDAHAWAHHPWMSTWTGSVVLAPGDVVYMRRGDSWSIANPSYNFMTVSQSGSAGKPITTTWYGTSGNKPLIQITGNYPYAVIRGYGKSYITFDHLDIQHYSWVRNMSDTYYGIAISKDGSNNVSHDWIITNCDIHNIPNIGICGMDDSYNITIGDRSASYCATNSSFSNHIYKCGYAGIGLSGRDPVTKSSNWDISFNYIHDIDSAGTEIHDIYGIYFSSGTESNGWPSNCTARFNRIDNIINWHGIDCHGGKYINIYDNYIYNCQTGVAMMAADRANLETAILDNCNIERNTVEFPGKHPLLFYSGISVDAENSSHRATNCTIRDNTIFYRTRPDEKNGRGITVHTSDGVAIEGNNIYNGPISQAVGAIRIGGDSSWKTKNITVRNNWINNWDAGVCLLFRSIDGNVFINNNIIHSNLRSLAGEVGDFTGEIKVYNNVLLSTWNTLYDYAIGFDEGGTTTIPASSSLVIKNNIIGFVSPASRGTYIRTPGTVNGTLTVDYNLYWNSTSTNQFDLQGTYLSWADWKTNGYDTHSLDNTDPLFVNSSGSYSESLDFALKSVSPGINTGTVVDGVTVDFWGTARDASPDIGAYEYTTASQTVLVSGITITGAGGANSITTYKGTLQLTAAVLPLNATNKTVTWSVTNGTGQASVNSSGLLSAITNGTVTVRATATDGSGIYGTFPVTISNQVIVPVPVYVSSSVENTTPVVLELVFDQNLAAVVPPVSAFAVLDNHSTITVNNVAISGTSVKLTLASPVKYGDVVTIAYNKPAVNPLQTTEGGQVASFSAQNVKNNVANVAPAVLIISPGNNSVFESPANITISANASDSDGSVTLVEFYNGPTRLGSASAAPYSITWNNVGTGNYSLTAVATDNNNAKTTSPAILITVNEGVPAENQPPVVSISNPAKGKKYENPADVEISVTAYDPDGSISKVELYNGAEKIAEMTSAPYVFVWKDLSAGTYTITAVATDNLKATATSSPVEFRVGDIVRYDGDSEIVNLYPNPNDGHFSIEFTNPLQNEKSEVIIVDLAGKKVYEEVIYKEETLKQFDLSYLKSGIFVMLIYDKGIIVTKKFLKN